ncbi:hypothetical protein GPECTOR_50g584 [Gonium pectorale]|uniref:A-kinase anchor protein 7-like phosphoesterase domain-containing protein n=1 Tax=Gonium pectorale TaxID=33097 RepID=A0A150G8U9_GONPE|nr:hypothetical protein GPECTOR_50g584 [Gonium pectorale]|eukprot:KXZ45790.1 hypothetical protein GPECTOR_50g584 [Gonium pectorale]
MEVDAAGKRTEAGTEGHGDPGGPGATAAAIGSCPDTATSASAVDGEALTAAVLTPAAGTASSRHRRGRGRSGAEAGASAGGAAAAAAHTCAAATEAAVGAAEAARSAAAAAEAAAARASQTVSGILSGLARRRLGPGQERSGAAEGSQLSRDGPAGQPPAQRAELGDRPPAAGVAKAVGALEPAQPAPVGAAAGPGPGPGESREREAGGEAAEAVAAAADKGRRGRGRDAGSGRRGGGQRLEGDADAGAGAAGVRSERGAEGGGGVARRGDVLGSLMDRSPLPDRPTHFLALQLSHSRRVTEAIDQVHAALVGHHASLADFLEPSVKAHLTLLVMPLHQGHMPLLPPAPVPAPLTSPAAAPPPAAQAAASDVPTGVPAAEAEGAVSAAPLVPAQPVPPAQAQAQAQAQTASSEPLGGSAPEQQAEPEMLVPEPEPMLAEPQPPQPSGRQGRSRQRQAPGSAPAAAQSRQELPWRLVACLQRMLELPGALGSAGVDRPLELEVKGLNAFGSQVLFLEVADDDRGDEAPMASAEAAPTAGPDLAAALNDADAGEATTDGGSSALNANGSADGPADRPTGQRAALLALQAAVAAHFADFKFREDGKPFVPHVTIAKAKYMPPSARTRGSRGNSGGCGGAKGSNGPANGDGTGKDGGSQDASNPRQAAEQAAAPLAAQEESDPHHQQQEGADCALASTGATGTEPAAAEARGTGQAGSGAAAVPIAQANEAMVPETAHRSVTDGPGNPSSELPCGQPVATAAAAAAGARSKEPAAASSKPLSKIPAAAYEAHMDISAGLVTVDRVQLCAMGGRPQGGYYRVLAEVALRGAAGGGDAGCGGGVCGRGEVEASAGPGRALAEPLRPYPSLHPAVRLTEQAMALLHAAAEAAKVEEAEARLIEEGSTGMEPEVEAEGRADGAPEALGVKEASEEREGGGM